MSKKILLTGGLGFIGHHLAMHLFSKGFTPLLFDNFSHNIQNKWHQWVVDYRYDQIKKEGILLSEGDARSFDELQSFILEHKPNKIIHLSAIPSILLSNQNPGKAIDNNFVTTRNLLETIRLHPQLNIDQFIFFSSSTVYGDCRKEIVTEESPVTPKGIYEASKLSCELIIKAYHNIMGLPYTIVRPSALYGSGCINNRVSQAFIEQVLADKPIKIEGDGKEKLAFTYIKDLLEAILLILNNPKAINQTFNVTVGQTKHIIDLVDILKEYVPDVQIEYIPRNVMRPKRGDIDISKIQKLLGYSPKYSLDLGYRECIQWYLDSPFKEISK